MTDDHSKFGGEYQANRRMALLLVFDMSQRPSMETACRLYGENQKTPGWV